MKKPKPAVAATQTVTLPVTNAFLNQGIISFPPDRALELGIHHRSTVRVTIGEEKVLTAWKFANVRLGKCRTEVERYVKRYKPRPGDKLVLTFNGHHDVGITIQKKPRKLGRRPRRHSTH